LNKAIGLPKYQKITLCPLDVAIASGMKCKFTAVWYASLAREKAAALFFHS